MNLWLILGCTLLATTIGLLGWGPRVDEPTQVHLMGAALIATSWSGVAAFVKGAALDAAVSEAMGLAQTQWVDPILDYILQPYSIPF
ncbi:MAG: hypothetical protein JO019_00165 [Candidatus Kaiserbacteria bacterium]|nr:hypothetical protein [Candidatus Kaiserbacteria bacterium]